MYCRLGRPGDAHNLHPLLAQAWPVLEASAWHTTTQFHPSSLLPLTQNTCHRQTNPYWLQAAELPWRSSGVALPSLSLPSLQGAEGLDLDALAERFKANPSAGSALLAAAGIAGAATFVINEFEL